MANCSYCNSWIIFGARKDAFGTYCSDKCQVFGNCLAASNSVPQVEIDREIEVLLKKPCPRCGRPGPVDFHKSYKVWSALILTSWSTNPDISCKSCATMRQLEAIAFSGVLGWWGFPWGIILTPVQVSRNLIDMVKKTSPGKSSPMLERAVRFQVGAKLLSQRGALNTLQR